MAVPSRLERYMLNLINAERAEVGRKPLAFDPDLNEAAESHSEWMLRTDRFSHTGAGGSGSQQRVDAAGYDLTGGWILGENIALTTAPPPAGDRDEVRELHQDLMRSSGHRANILDSDFTELGIGIEVGDFGGRTTVVVTQDFAGSGDGTDFA